MESVPWEHEKRTLSARLQCRGVCMLVLEYMQEANVKPFCATSHFGKKEAILNKTVRASITVKLRHFVVLIKGI